MDLYYMAGAAPCRAVQMVAKALGIELNLIRINVLVGEQMMPEFIKINPQHTIPTLVDNGFSLWESRAILVYLVEKYGKNDYLYPKDIKKRAAVNQKLYFDMGTLYKRFAEYYYPQLFTKQPANPENLKKFEDALEFLNIFLEGQKYITGDNLTVADITLVTSVSTFEAVNFDFSKYTNITKWFELCKATCPGYDINEAGIEEFKTYFGSK